MRLITDPREAARFLADGQLVALPTETVYGLGARADRPRAVARIYAAKGRPADHPLIVHIAAQASLDAWAIDIPDYARELAEHLWPGPMTLILNRSDRAGDFVTGGQSTVGLRVPAHPLFLETLQHLQSITDDPHIGIAAPSANRFGRVSPTTAQHVMQEFEDEVGVVLDGGGATVGVESTIIDCTEALPVIVRPGAITADDVKHITGKDIGDRTTVRAPGTLASHYAPRATVRIVDEAEASNVTDADATIGFLALEHIPTPAHLVRLAAPTNADEYAHVLYAALREADALKLSTILVVPPADVGVGAAVIDRITRAAHSG